MAKKSDAYKKYQVYFFLYLAVICEILIVIVERDDAETNLLIKQRELEKKNRAIILELLKNMPAVAAAGDNQLKVNETRSFTVRVKGLGEKDEVTTPPIVHVYKDANEIQTIHYSTDRNDKYSITDSTLQSTTGERLYRFTWIADKGAGQFEFHVEAGTNRIELKADPSQNAMVKVGTLDFKRTEIEAALNSDASTKGKSIENYIRQSENLDPARFIVDVIPEMYEQLQILAENVVTAIGVDTYNEIKVRGTTTEKVVAMDPSLGTCLDPKNSRNPYRTDDPTKGKWVWNGKFTEAGTKTVNVTARDNRGAAGLSIARPITFNVTVKQPYLRRKKPRSAFAGELFTQNVDVQGLDIANQYSWKLESDGKVVLDSTGPLVRYSIPDDQIGKTLTIKALYDGRQYMWQDSTKNELKTSEFEYKVSAPLDNIYELFEADGTTYPQSFEFGFEAVRCGVCIKANEKAIPPNEINVEAVKQSGGSLPVNWIPKAILNEKGKEVSTKVTFRIGGRVGKNGEMVVIKITAGQATSEDVVKLKGQ